MAAKTSLDNANLKDLTRAFNQIKLARGKEKLPLIKSYSQNPAFGELFLSICDFVYNPRIASGIAKKKMNKELNLGLKPIVTTYKPLNYVLNYIKENNTGSDKIVFELQTYINAQHEETREFLEKVFTQDLQIGASEKTINEALGYEFIPIHQVMLAKKWQDYSDKVKGKFYITQKMDDYRCTCIFNEKTNKWELTARSGLLYKGVVDIENILENLPVNYVYDGGLISTNTKLNSKARFRDTGKKLRKLGEKHGLMFYMYDMLPKEEYLAGKSKLGYEDRQEQIHQLLDFDTLEDCEKDLFQKVPRWYEGTDKDKVMELLQVALDKELEGLIINTANGKYELVRSKELLKVKEFYTCDLKIVDYKEHKNPGLLGAFICEYKDHTVSVGGGFKQAQREEFWKNRESMIGKIIEVRYFQESENEQGKKSIRHPHFVQLRWDKNEPSYD